MALGVVLTPYGNIPGSFPAGITRSFKGSSTWQKPFDPQWYTRGEAGYYYDTPLGATGKPSLWQRLRAKLGGGLGAIPTDFEIAKTRGYLPVMSGWVVTDRGYQTGGWLPPTGHYPGSPPVTWPPLAPRSGVNGLGQVPAEPPTVEDVMATMQAHNDRIFALTLVSTSAVAISALIGLFRTLKLIREDK